MKVLLFNPPGPHGRGHIREGRCTQETGVWATQWPPVSLATAAALLGEDGHDVGVIDFPALGLGISALTETIRRKRPEMAVWSTGTPTLPFDLQMAGLIKGESPETVTAVIGTHVTVRPEDALREPAVDIVVRGEPERIIRNLCAHHGAGWETIRGISCRTGSGNDLHDGSGIRHNPAEDFIPAEAIPRPAWHTLDIRPYRLPLKGRPFLIVAPVRGCPYRCSFCTAPIYYGNKLRERPVEKVMDEIEENVSGFGVGEFFIWADTFTVNRHYVKQFCRAIRERKLRVSWTCNSRVDTVDAEMLGEMKEAGLWMISFGLESGSDDVLTSMNKKISVAQSAKAVHAANRLGIRVAGHFILGLPGETEKTMEQTLSLALNLPLDIAQFYAAAPFPGTPLYAEALRQGWLKSGQNGDSAEFCSQGDAVMALPGLPADRVNAFRRQAYRRFYARPRVIKRILSMVEPGAAKQAAANMKRFLKWATS
ncbi:MAG: radical SAM protein [Pseudomonadota bacterium]